MSKNSQNNEENNQNSNQVENKGIQCDEETLENPMENNILNTEETHESDIEHEILGKKSKKKEKKKEDKKEEEKENEKEDEKEEKIEDKKEEKKEEINEIKLNTTDEHSENENNKLMQNFEEFKFNEEKKEEIVYPYNRYVKPVFENTKFLLKKLKEVNNTLKNEIQNNNDKRQNYTKRISNINKEMKSQKDLKISINVDMNNLDQLISIQIKKIDRYNRLKKGRNSVERGKKELFLYNSSEDIINVKQKQFKNVSKLNTILDKDISKINSNLKKVYYLDEDIQKENPEIKSKAEELIYIYNKLNTDISIIKTEIQMLKNIKDAHNICDKQIIKLKKELKTLQQKKDLKIFYLEAKSKKKEMNEIKRKQIVEMKALDSKKFKSILTTNSRSNYSINKKDNKLLNKMKNKLFRVSTKENIINNNKIRYFENETNVDNKLNFELIDNSKSNNEDSLEKKFRALLLSKREEKNKIQRKINSEIEEITKEKMLKEAELNKKELKRLNLQKMNFETENMVKINKAKIKVLNKQLNELKIEEDNYDKQIVKKELAILELKNIVDSINKMKQSSE